MSDETHQTSTPFGQATAGAVTILPIVVAVLPIGLLFGAVAAQKGLSPLEVALMSATVFAGGSQFVAIDIWQDPVSIGVMTFSALLVNIRHILMGASFAPKLKRFSRGQKYVAAFFLVDEIWAVAERRAMDRTITPAWYAGLALPLYAAWLASTTTGSIVGAALGDPSRYGLDFVFPAVFIFLVAGFWKGPKTGAVLAASTIAAVVTHTFVEGAWYIAAGALAGVATAAFATDVETLAPPAPEAAFDSGDTR
ncbi:branched-chain amino acid ABC transporter permease [Stappia sp. GBMRC 2046]|uniref:Branched-chain amino acid ABC transporter permease n=1 Tax=Stappia sediminis TaxID=2692190 RepID=A0A7X3LR25_9HYPH|nr:AzlC family ABC transporter permease [Stappia sediminis]MXN63536.1 branched-chain amino acid ABC transporter permease [Stappia sediminis]